MKEQFPEYDLTPKDGLSKRDKDMLYESGTSLMEQFLSDYPDQFPDGLIYPELGARPLAYLVSPVIHRAAQQRGVDVPATIFFKIMSTRVGMRGANFWELENDESLEDHIAYRDDAERLLYEVRDATLNPLKKIKAQKYIYQNRKDAKMPRGLLKVRTLMREALDQRSNDIYDRARDKGIGDPTFAIIDDAISGIGTTQSELEIAFGQNIPVYGFLLNDDIVHTHPDDVSWGMLNDPQSKDFEYTEDRMSIGYMKEGPLRNIYSEPFPPGERDLSAMAKLRRDMREIGNRIAEELLPSEDESLQGYAPELY